MASNTNSETVIRSIRSGKVRFLKDDYQSDKKARSPRTRFLDKTMIGAFEKTILANEKRLKDAVVLEIGCGKGFLTLMLAKAGAKKIIAFDKSDNMELKKVVNDNKLDNITTIIQGDLETMELPGGITQVDAIVSNWTGLENPHLYSIIPLILTARDRWLKKDGFIIPSNVMIYLGPTDDQCGRERIFDWWKDFPLYYTDTSSSIPTTVLGKDPDPEDDRKITQTMPGGPPISVHNLDLLTADRYNLSYEFNFSFKAVGFFNLRAFATYYHVGFPTPLKPNYGLVRFGQRCKCDKTARHNRNCKATLPLKEVVPMNKGEEVIVTLKTVPEVEKGTITKVNYILTWNIDGEYVKKCNQVEVFRL